MPYLMSSALACRRKLTVRASAMPADTGDVKNVSCSCYRVFKVQCVPFADTAHA